MESGTKEMNVMKMYLVVLKNVQTARKTRDHLIKYDHQIVKEKRESNHSTEINVFFPVYVKK